MELFNDDEDDVIEIQVERYFELRLERQYLRDASNPLTLPPQYFARYYRYYLFVYFSFIINKNQ